MAHEDVSSYHDALADLTTVIQEEVMNALLKVDIELACDILHKYLTNPNQLTRETARDKLLYTDAVIRFFKDNNRGPNKEKDLSFIECLKKLANYAAILLKPQHMRPDSMWETIMTSNPIFEGYIAPFNSYSLVLEALGYKLIGESYTYMKGRVTLDTIKNVCSDLLVLRAYMEVSQNVKRVKPVELPERSEVKRTAPLKVPDAESLCEICSKPAMFFCSDKDCEGKAWCDTCNQKWHVNNSKRKNHPYKPIPNVKLPANRKPLPAISGSNTPPLAPRRQSGYLPSPETSSPVQSPRPVPAPRRNNKAKLDNSGSSLMANNQPIQQREDPGYKREIRNLEKLVNEMLPSEDIGLFEQRIQTINKAMADLQTKIATEPPNSTKKVQYNTELIALNKQKDRLDDRLSDLERAKRDSLASSRVFEEADLIEDDQAQGSLPHIDDDDAALSAIVNATTPTPLTYLKCVMDAEIAGYSMEEIIMGLNNAPFRELIEWLTNIYPVIQNDVQQTAETTPYIPKLTSSEIKKAIVAYAQGNALNAGSLNTQPIMTLCLNNRKNTVKSFCEVFAFDEEPENGFFEPVNVITEKIVSECIYEADGDPTKTMRFLNDRVEEKVREHIWSPVEVTELEPLGDQQRPVRRAALAVFNSNADRNAKLMIAIAEFNMTYAHADELVHLMEEYYGKGSRKFEVKDAVIALSAAGIPAQRLHRHAVMYLSNECILCFDKFPSHEMANLCCHDSSQVDMGCCKGCVRDQFAYFINSEPVAKVMCPARCGAPGENITADQASAHVFFESLLSVVFPNIELPADLVTKFNNKLACWRLSMEPNFHWCPNGSCSENGYGFLDEGERLRIACPRCGTSIKCRQCKKSWKDEHENRTCDDFATWERENTDEYVGGVRQRDEFLDEHGIQCPSCKAQFHLAKGGCMDCVCPTCNFQFCNGCGTQLFPKECPRNAELDCQKLGLHGHHPRNCHSYLRDFTPEELKELLEDNEVEFGSGETGEKCEQEIEDDNNHKYRCNEEEKENGMCTRHYTEYLTATINQHKLEVLSLMSIQQLIMVLKRGGVEIPDDTDVPDDEYCEQLIAEIEEKIPFDDLSAYKLY